MDFLISSTSIKFNKSGNWELQLFSNDKFLGNMNVYVTKEKVALLLYGAGSQLLDSSRRKITDKYRN
ncbi:MAG: hypothetical protein ACQEW5_27160 [Bacillota bacterium]